MRGSITVIAMIVIHALHILGGQLLMSREYPATFRTVATRALKSFGGGSHSVKVDPRLSVLALTASTGRDVKRLIRMLLKFAM